MSPCPPGILRSRSNREILCGGFLCIPGLGTRRPHWATHSDYRIYVPCPMSHVPCPPRPLLYSTVLYATSNSCSRDRREIRRGTHATCRHQSVGTRYCCYRRGVNCSYMPYSFLPPATATNHLRQQVIPQATKLRAYLVLELLLLAVKQSRDTAA